jgi:hypothetical protein
LPRFFCASFWSRPMRMPISLLQALTSLIISLHTGQSITQM